MRRVVQGDCASMLKADVILSSTEAERRSYAEGIYSLSTKFLARDSGEWTESGNTSRRHDYLGGTAPGESGRHAEAWRFPVVEPFFSILESADENVRWNKVTFIYRHNGTSSVPTVKLTGLPYPNLRSLELPQIEDSCYLAVTVLLPAGRLYNYCFVVNGQVQPDTINPQRQQLPNGEEVSVFFTLNCSRPVLFEPWERTILRRLTSHILPFNSREGELFQLRPGSGAAQPLSAQLHKFDHSIGVSNYIDKLLAREERHHLSSYKTCLAQINRILRSREPFLEPRDIPEHRYVDLYHQMSSGNTVADWDYKLYDNPGYFLFLLRRHVWTGAFSHPKYGGNANGTGWLWLSDQFPFDYAAALEAPYGNNSAYRG